MAKEYIEREALKKAFDERYDTAFVQERTRENKEFWNGLCSGVNWGRNTIADAPTADVVEVVRCKDCFHCLQGGYCKTIADGRATKAVNDNFYCGYGERRDGE